MAGIVAANPSPSTITPTSTASSTVTTHPEKITHAVGKLAAAGLGSATSTSSSSKHYSNKKWIIIGSVVGAVVLIVILLLAWVLYRRYKKKRAYAMVSRGVDMTGTPAWRVTSPEGETSGPRPLFLSQGMVAARGREGRERGRGMSVGGLDSHPMTGGRQRSASATPSIRGRNRESYLGERGTGREMFDQEKEMEVEREMRDDGRRIAGEGFERGYDEVETGYGDGGDRRSAGA